MYQFFVEPGQIQDKEITILGSDVNHIKNVLRMKVGEEISVSNGIDGKEYRCGITALEEDRILCGLRFIREDAVELPSQVYLFQGLPKADKLELIIQKNVELGVHAIIPVATKRCVVRLDEKKEKSKLARWQGIAEAAAKQSRRAIIPQVHPVMPLQDAFKYVKDFEVKLIPYELATDMEKTRSLMEAVKPGQRVAVFIGPEGGFDQSEIQGAFEAGIEPVTLGKRILRTETAGMTVMSWLMYRLEGAQTTGPGSV